MAGETVDIAIRARVDDFEREMKKIPGISEKEIRAASRAMQKAWKMPEPSASADAAFGKAGQSASKLAGFLGMVSPEAEKAARAINDMADVGEVGAGAMSGLGVSVGTAAVAVAAVTSAAIIGYGVWATYAIEVQHAAREQAALNSIMAEAEAAAGRLANVEVDVQVATGDLTAEEAKYTRGVTASKKALDDRIEAVLKETGVTKKQLDIWKEAAKVNPAALGGAPQAIQEAVVRVGVLNAEYDQTADKLAKIRDAEAAHRKAVEDKAAATKAAAERARLNREEEAMWDAETERRHQEAYDADDKRAREEEAMWDRETELRQKQTEAEAQYWQTRHDTALAAIQAQQLAEEEAAAVADAAAKARVEQALATADAIAGGAETAIGAWMDYLEQTGKAGSELYSTLAAAHKAAAIAGIVVSTAASVMRGFEQAGPIGGAALAALSIAAGAAQSAIVAATPESFHAGGVVRSPDEVPITARQGEGVLTARGVEAIGGPTALRNANRGAAPQGPQVLVTVVGHKAVDAVLADSVTTRSSPLYRALRRGTVAGHRRR